MSEAEEHKAIVQWFKAQWPQYRKSVRVSMSGLPRYGTKGAIQWNMMKSAGVEDGEADIAIMLPRGGFSALLLEHKSDTAIRGATESQIEYIQYHNSIGNKALVTKGVEMAKAVIREYMEQDYCI